MRLAIAVSRLG